MELKLIDRGFSCLVVKMPCQKRACQGGDAESVLP